MLHSFNADTTENETSQGREWGSTVNQMWNVIAQNWFTRAAFIMTYLWSTRTDDNHRTTAFTRHNSLTNRRYCHKTNDKTFITTPPHPLPNPKKLHYLVYCLHVNPRSAHSTQTCSGILKSTMHHLNANNMHMVIPITRLLHITQPVIYSCQIVPG